MSVQSPVRGIVAPFSRLTPTVRLIKSIFLMSVQQIDTHRETYKKYFPDVGARVYEENRKNCGNHSKVMEAWEFNKFAEKMILEKKWSPDAVVGHAKRHKKFEYIPSTKTLYNWIDEGKLSIINIDLAM